MSTNESLPATDQFLGQRKSLRRAFLITFFVFLVSLFFTMFAWWQTRNSIRQRAQLEFERLTDEMVDVVQARFEGFINVLYGTQGLLTASSGLDRNEWASYFERQRLRERYPGITALQFIERVKDKDKNAFIEEIRSDRSISTRGYPHFTTHSVEEQKPYVVVREEYFVVKYVEPFKENEEMMGLDVSSDPIALNAIERARDTGEPAGSGRINFQTSAKEIGFFILLPVYWKEMAVLTVTERREALLGFVNVVLRANDFFAGIFDKKTIYSNIHYKIFDGEVQESSLTDDHLLFDSGTEQHDIVPGYRPRFAITTKLDVAGQIWNFQFYPGPAFNVDGASQILPYIVLVGGLILSFLLWGILYSLSSSRLRAVALAHEMTVELRENEAKLLKALSDLRKTHSELKTAQVQLVQAEKSATVAQLAAGVAHEVKNPLAILLQGVDYLSHDPESKGHKDPNVSSVLTDMGEAVKRADYVIQGLFDLTRNTLLTLEPEDLNSIIEHCLLLIKILLDRSHIQVFKFFNPYLPKVKIDRSKMVQIFINLLTNAVDAMSDGGTLTIKTYSTKLTEFSPQVGRRKEDTFKLGQEVVTMEIEDTGKGIPDEILDKVFEPFFTTRRGKGGTGLGLTVVRSVVEMHHGTIKIVNKQGGGGVIATVTLPVV